MCDFLKSSGRRLRAGWFWPLVLLALPSCILNAGAYPTEPPAFDPGPEPHSSAIMCDIPKVPPPGSDGCASSTDIANGMSMSYAAVALAQGEKNSLVLDFSPDATAACGGLPKKTEFFGPFPDGRDVCLNCGTQIPAVYADADAACVAVCIDLVHNSEGGDPPQGADAYCQANAHASTNFVKNECYDDACSDGGTLRMDFVDPRRTPEPVKWIEQNGTSGGSSGNDLTRTAGRSGNFDAGGYSAQLIKKGDGWVEFEVSDNTKAYAVGVASGDTDSVETLDDIPFALVLQSDGHVYVYESGIQVGGDLGTYNAGDRFRVNVKDNNDGSTATISASKLNGTCTEGTICSVTPIAAQVGPSPAYPLRVDASLVDPDAILKNVTLVRIQ